MATYTFAGTFPANPSQGETMDMNGVTYIFGSDGAWGVETPITFESSLAVEDGGLSENNFTNADHTKLDAIEANATADQTKADIEALGIAASSITGALPAIDGASLTGIEGVPSGIISMWHGAAANIPSGWLLCDGTNSTPNLVGKFIKGGSTAGTTGGSNTHSHSHTLSAGSHTLTIAEMPSHSHSVTVKDNPSSTGHLYDSPNGSNVSRNTSATGGGGSHSHSLSGSIADGSNEPAYYELCYIMKS